MKNTLNGWITIVAIWHTTTKNARLSLGYKYVRRVGIFAGTFDPVHNGHIKVALTAAKKFHLEAVYFLPERQPRRKHNITDYEHRRKMLELAMAEEGILNMLSIPDSQFTIPGTMPKLKKLFPDSQIFLLMGSDVARHMDEWPGIENLEAEVIVAMRRNDKKKSIPRPQINYIKAPESALSSSQIRQSEAGATPLAVLDYISKNRLYG